MPDGGIWAAAAAEEDDFSDAPAGARIAHLADDPDLLRNAGGFLLLSSVCWSETDTAALIDALLENPRPLIVANPDLVAPERKGCPWSPA